MTMRIRCRLALVAACSMAAPGLMFSGVAHATDGYFAHGYGMKAQGRGGAAMAFADDAFGGANNPADMVWVGDRLDVGATLFMPIRGASRSGSAGSMGAGDPGRDFNEDSDRHYFVIPEIGFAHQLNDRMAVGIDLYGNGGLNTYYQNNAITNGGCGAAGNNNALCGTGRLGVNLMQAIIAPTFAYRLTPTMSIGISPLLGVQMFKAQGLQAFTAVSNSPNNVTNKGTDISYGYGARIGYMYRPTGWLSLGAAYSTKVYMSPFNRYQGLFANGGKFDIPANYGAGFMVTPIPEINVGFDWQRIQYHDVPATGDASNVPLPLGSHGGPGFNWQDANVYKFGVEMWPKGKMTVRFGYNHSTQVITSQAITFNILSPGVVQDHVTLGFTYRFGKASEITGMYMHAFTNYLSGQSAQFGGTEQIHMLQNSFGLAYGLRF